MPNCSRRTSSTAASICTAHYSACSRNAARGSLMATAIKTIFTTAAPVLVHENSRAAVSSFQPPFVPQNDRWATDALRVKEVEDRLTNLHNSLVCAMNQLLDLKDLGTG